MEIDAPKVVVNGVHSLGPRVKAVTEANYSISNDDHLSVVGLSDGISEGIIFPDVAPGLMVYVFSDVSAEIPVTGNFVNNALTEILPGETICAAHLGSGTWVLISRM